MTFLLIYTVLCFEEFESGDADDMFSKYDAVFK